jgi:hypothetical protein
MVGMGRRVRVRRSLWCCLTGFVSRVLRIPYTERPSEMEVLSDSPAPLGLSRRDTDRILGRRHRRKRLVRNDHQIGPWWRHCSSRSPESKKPWLRTEPGKVARQSKLYRYNTELVSRRVRVGDSLHNRMWDRAGLGCRRDGLEHYAESNERQERREGYPWRYRGRLSRL